MQQHNGVLEKNICVVCRAHAVRKCGICEIVHYCCIEHLKADWDNHKLTCVPVNVVAKLVYKMSSVVLDDDKDALMLLIEKHPNVL